MVAPIVTHKLLRKAIATANINLVKKILKANFLPPEYPNPDDGKPLFFYAIEYHQNQILEYLIKDIDDSNVLKDFKGNTALITAINAKNFYALQLCLEKYPSSINVKNDEGMTALLFATTTGQFEMVDALIIAGMLFGLLISARCKCK